MEKNHINKLYQVVPTSRFFFYVLSMSFLCPFYVLFGFFSDSFSLFGRVRRGNGFILFERPNSLKETFKLLKFHFLRKKWTLFLQKCTELVFKKRIMEIIQRWRTHSLELRTWN